MIKGIVINKSQLKKKIGYIIENEEDFYNNNFKYIVVAYINGENPILIKSKLPQEQWDLFCDNQLPKKELDMYI